MNLCFQGCDIVWPKQVGTVLGVRFCQGVSPLIKNNWWRVAGYAPGGMDGYSGWRADAVIADNGTRPCQAEITGTTGKYIKYHITTLKDVGKTIKIFGTQYGNQPIMEQDGSGNWTMGLALTATAAGVQSTMLVTKITSVVREATQKRTWLYSVDPTSSDLQMLGQYEPEETNPAYRCSRIQNLNALPYELDDYERKIRHCTALVKLEFVPAVDDTDWVLLSNLDALKLGIQGLKLEEANDDVQAQIKFQLAIKELNMELRDRFPSGQTTVQINSIGSHFPILNPV